MHLLQTNSIQFQKKVLKIDRQNLTKQYNTDILKTINISLLTCKLKSLYKKLLNLIKTLIVKSLKDKTYSEYK